MLDRPVGTGQREPGDALDVGDLEDFDQLQREQDFHAVSRVWNFERHLLQRDATFDDQPFDEIARQIRFDRTRAACRSIHNWGKS